MRDTFKKSVLPRLNGLSKMTLESTVLKLMEESGELAQAISKFRGMNGEVVDMTEGDIVKNILGELVDVMQVCASLTFILEDKYGIDIDDVIEEHVAKLVKKGYYIPNVKQDDTNVLGICRDECDVLGVYELFIKYSAYYTDETHRDELGKLPDSIILKCKSFTDWLKKEIGNNTFKVEYVSYMTDIHNIMISLKAKS